MNLLHAKAPKRYGARASIRLHDMIHGDILKQDYSSADVVTAYLLPKAMQLVRPILEKQLKKGCRVVAHDFEMIGWTPEKVESIEDDGEGRSHTIFLYRR